MQIKKEENSMADNVHEGHRKRFKEQFLSDGMGEHFADHQLLELLLYYSIPRKDTNELAHTLLNRFGSIKGILNAPVEELTAVLLHLILPLYRRYAKDDQSGKTVFSLEDICRFIMDKYCGITRETFALTSFDATGRIIGFDILNTGDVSSVGISSRAVLETAIKRHAVAVTLSHNHPTGFALPSKEDLEATSRIDTALSHIGVALLDHIIVAGNDCVSLAQSKGYDELFKSRLRPDNLP